MGKAPQDLGEVPADDCAIGKRDVRRTLEALRDRPLAGPRAANGELDPALPREHLEIGGVFQQWMYCDLVDLEVGADGEAVGCGPGRDDPLAGSSIEPELVDRQLERPVGEGRAECRPFDRDAGDFQSVDLEARLRVDDGKCCRIDWRLAPALAPLIAAHLWRELRDARHLRRQRRSLQKVFDRLGRRLALVAGSGALRTARGCDRLGLGERRRNLVDVEIGDLQVRADIGPLLPQFRENDATRPRLAEHELGIVERDRLASRDQLARSPETAEQVGVREPGAEPSDQRPDRASIEPRRAARLELGREFDRAVEPGRDRRAVDRDARFGRGLIEKFRWGVEMRIEADALSLPGKITDRSQRIADSPPADPEVEVLDVMERARPLVVIPDARFGERDRPELDLANVGGQSARLCRRCRLGDQAVCLVADRLSCRAGQACAECRIARGPSSAGKRPVLQAFLVDAQADHG